MDLALIVGIEIIYSIASLVLISAGLAVVFGMMRIINLAHGEFLMMGGYATIVAVNAGFNVYFAMLVIAPLVVGAIGLIIERTVIRFLYGRLIASMLATWGLSLFFVGAVTMIFGNTTTGISTPIPGFAFGEYQINGYNLFIIAITIILLIAMYAVLSRTRIGLTARAVMQNPEMASALGTNPGRVYMLTFTVGAALSGLAGGVLAPLVGIFPASGSSYIAKAFITVITGGASVITGTLSSAVLLGLFSQLVTFFSTPVFGELTLLVVAIVLLRLLPQGITGRFFKGRF